MSLAIEDRVCNFYFLFYTVSLAKKNTNSFLQYTTTTYIYWIVLDGKTKIPPSRNMVKSLMCFTLVNHSYCWWALNYGSRETKLDSSRSIHCYLTSLVMSHVFDWKVFYMGILCSNVFCCSTKCHKGIYVDRWLDLFLIQAFHILRLLPINITMLRNLHKISQII